MVTVGVVIGSVVGKAAVVASAAEVNIVVVVDVVVVVVVEVEVVVDVDVVDISGLVVASGAGLMVVRAPTVVSITDVVEFAAALPGVEYSAVVGGDDELAWIVVGLVVVADCTVVTRAVVVLIGKPAVGLIKPVMMEALEASTRSICTKKSEGIVEQINQPWRSVFRVIGVDTTKNATKNASHVLTDILTYRRHARGRGKGSAC